MLHWNFSKNSFRAFSLGIEAAYWSYARSLEDENAAFVNLPNLHKPGFGLDIGLEGDVEGIRLYAEPQIGIAFAGLSLGTVLQFTGMNRLPQLGIQGSGWVNAIAGMDLRYLRLGGENIQAFGLYGKLPMLVSGRRSTSLE